MLKKVKFFNSETGQWEIVAVAEKGDQGPKGDKGDKGDTGEQGIQGERGYHFTPSVDVEGNLSWSNDGELENPEEVNIKGPQGEPGLDGVQSNSINAIEVVPELPAEGEWINGVLYIVVEGEGGE